MITINFLLLKFKENYWQIFLLIILLFQNKILIDVLSVEGYGKYIFQISIGSIIGLIFPIGFNAFIRRGIIKKEFSVIGKYFKIALIFSIVSSIIFIIIYALTSNIVYFFYWLFYLSILFNNYDIILLSLDKVNISRGLLFFQSLTFIILIFFLPEMHHYGYLIIFSLLSLIRVMFGWFWLKKYVIKDLDFSFNPISKKDKKYIFKTSFSDYLNSFVSHIDSVFLGYMSAQQLGVFQLHRIIPNSIKSNVKLLFIKEENKLLNQSTTPYYQRFINFIFTNTPLFVIIILLSNLLTYLYIDIFLDNDISSSLLLSVIFSLTIIFKVYNSLLTNQDIFLENASFYFRFNFYNKLLYLLVLFLAIYFSSLIFVSLIILLNDLIIFLFYLLRIKNKNK